MGKLYYGPQGEFDFDDRALIHLRSVIVAKLLRQESFVFTWADGDLRRSVWMHPSTHLTFEFDSGEEHDINRAWLEVLAELANTPSGLRLVPEPEES